MRPFRRWRCVVGPLGLCPLPSWIVQMLVGHDVATRARVLILFETVISEY